MNNFARAIRIALDYRWTFAASIVSALCIALLWGGNIGTIYPFVEVAFDGKSLHDWSAESVAALEQEVAELRDQLAALDRPTTADASAEVSPDAPAASAVATAPAKPTAPADTADQQRERRALAERLEDREQRAQWHLLLREHVIEPYMPRSAFATLVVIVGALLLGTLIKCFFTFVHCMLVGRLSLLTTFRLRQTFYRRTLEMEVARFGSDGAGDLMNRFTSDMESLAGGLNELFGKLVREPLKAAACLIGAAWVCWRLLIFSLILAPLAAYLIRALARSLKRANRRAMEEMSQMYSILEETLQGIKAVKAFTMQRYERRRFHQNSKKYFLKQMRIVRYDAFSRPLAELLGMTTICLAVLAGAYLTINSQTHLLGIRMSDEPLSRGMLLLFFALLAGVSDPARKLSEVMSRLQRGSAAADRIYTLIDREPAIVDPVRPVALPRHRHSLAFEQVMFHYRPSQPVLSGIDLHVEHGETLAIVGPNGCGKSTLVNLVPRFYDPTAGAVRLDGIDLRSVRQRNLRSQIGLVTQETLLFDDTVFNNIRYGSPDASEAEVIAAAKQAHAHRFIEERLEHGYQTVVGPRGAMLSGGQRQRLALARAILRDPAILILDEATSQVDLESEQVIQRVLEQFTRGRTTLLVTHRMGALALADRIVVMDAGRIIDVGPHADLMRRCELYARLHEIQFREIA